MFIHLLQLLVTKLDTFSLAHTLNGGYLLNPEKKQFGIVAHVL